MREGIVCPRHTPGVYTTPVAFISANVLDLSFFVVISSCQKQSINDAFQYVAVLTHLPEGVGMNVAKLQKSYRIWLVFLKKLKIIAKILATLRNHVYLCNINCATIKCKIMNNIIKKEDLLAYIRSKIYVIRGKKVMLDKDLAELYGVETRTLNQKVKRNLKRFPSDFMFQMTKEDIA